MTAEDEAKQLDSVTDRVQDTELDASKVNAIYCLLLSVCCLVFVVCCL